MLIDASQLPPSAELQGDVCIIGTGAAGTALALELSRSGHDVILLEAGGQRAEPAAQDSLRGSADGSGDHDPLESIRQKRLGGTTMQWGGRCTPLDEIDFEHRAYVPSSGWPILQSDLQPYYRRAHEYLDIGEFEYGISRACVNPPSFLGAAPGTSTVVDDDRIWRFGPPVKFGRRFRTQLERSHRIRLFTHANVTELEQESGSGRVSAVRAASAPERYFTVRTKLVVVAAGGLESARLLLSSRCVQTGGIGSSSGWLGRGYMTHPVAEVGQLRLRSSELGRIADFMFTHDGVYCRRQLRLRPHIQRSEGLLNMGLALWYPDPMDAAHEDGLLSAFALVRKTLTATGVDWKATGTQRRFAQTSDVSKHLGNVAHDLPRLIRYGGYWVNHRYLARRRLPSFMTHSRSGLYRLRFDAEQSPEPQNRVELSSEKDSFGVPRLAVHFRVSRSDRESMIRTLELVRDEFHAQGVGQLTLPNPDQLLERQVFADGTHQMGVARMSSSPSTGVVDANCRVRDAANLFVASSAVFPTSGMCGPTLTITALALRLADHLDVQLAT